MYKFHSCGPAAHFARHAFERGAFAQGPWAKPETESGIQTTPAINIFEGTDAYTIQVAAPGLKKEFFKLRLENEILSISAEVSDSFFTDAQTGKEKRKEFAFGNFKRSFRLPASVDAGKIEAAYVDGILTVSLFKKEEQKGEPARTIEIS